MGNGMGKGMDNGMGMAEVKNLYFSNNRFFPSVFSHTQSLSDQLAQIKSKTFSPLIQPRQTQFRALTKVFLLDFIFIGLGQI
jgi:hypothetical protein